MRSPEMVQVDVPLLLILTVPFFPSASTRQVVTVGNVFRIFPMNSVCCPSLHCRVATAPWWTNATVAGNPSADVLLADGLDEPPLGDGLDERKRQLPMLPCGEQVTV